ncbi:MAG: T9SS type A sorting domain-containing protein [Bacteroidetes bacterium]|nr:T9SS type A sorting domain-containing protein [Bacteroidota bacterium]
MSGNYLDTLISVLGCDSIINYEIIVEDYIDTTIQIIDTLLVSNENNASYQWVDCDNSNAPISGEINQTFTATINGNYAVEITVGSCTETSACENITGVGVKETANHVVSIYPNPTSGMVNINLGSNNSSVNYSITSIEGKVVETGKTSSNNIVVDLSKEGNGVYFIKINNENTSVVYKLIKQ